MKEQFHADRFPSTGLHALDRDKEHVKTSATVAMLKKQALKLALGSDERISLEVQALLLESRQGPGEASNLILEGRERLNDLEI